MFLSIDVFSEHIQSDCCSFQEQNQPPLPIRDNNLTRISSSIPLKLRQHICRGGFGCVSEDSLGIVC